MQQVQGCCWLLLYMCKLTLRSKVPCAVFCTCGSCMSHLLLVVVSRCLKHLQERLDHTQQIQTLCVQTCSRHSDESRTKWQRITCVSARRKAAYISIAEHPSMCNAKRIMKLPIAKNYSVANTTGIPYIKQYIINVKQLSHCSIVAGPNRI